MMRSSVMRRPGSTAHPTKLEAKLTNLRERIHKGSYRARLMIEG
jgi:hypothetical protein